MRQPHEVASGSGSTADPVFLPPDLVARAATLPGVARVVAARQLPFNPA